MFKVGDRIRIVDYDGNLNGRLATVTAVRPKDSPIMIDFLATVDGWPDSFSFVPGADAWQGVAGYQFFNREVELVERKTEHLAPQTAKVLKMLETKGHLTAIEAAAVAKVRSLTKRIHELRQVGYVIRSEWKRDTEGQRYVRYHFAGRASQ